MKLRLPLLAVTVVSLSPLPCPLLGQARDTLLAGRRAYESVDYQGAVRLLSAGLAAPGAPRDSLWVTGVHMLADALLEQQQDSLAMLWARWASRTERGFRVDANAFPPRVARALLAARAAVDSTRPPGDSGAATTLEPAGDPARGRGTLRIARGNVSAFVVINEVGTVLPGESRTLPAGTYTLRITSDRFPPLVVAREVLPGFVTTVTPRLFAPAAAPPAVAAPSATAPAVPALTIRGKTIAAAGATTCAVLPSARVTCWGDNSAGQLGSGLADTSGRLPVIPAVEDSFRTISNGGGHACGLTSSGKAWCWGRGIDGELGTGRAASSPAPAAVAGNLVLVQLAAGGGHTCALTRAGAAHCWGSNREGQLGNRNTTASAVPVAVAVPQGTSFVAITSGTAHSCALTAAGAAWCWGANAAGQLGNGSTSNATAPVLVQAAAPWRSVAAGGAHTCGVTTTGAAWCWGSGALGQLGTGAAVSDETTRPVAVSGGLSFDSIAAGEAHSCGLTADGAAYCWGMGRFGQLGNGQMADSPRPVLVIGGAVYRAVALGVNHTCGVDAGAVTRCWGSNAQGQLGALAARGSAAPVAMLVRPAVRVASGVFTPPATVRERFDDNNWTVAPSWMVDSSTGVRFAVRDGAFEITRRGARTVAAAGLTLPVRIPVHRATQLQLDVMIPPDSIRHDCGLNCAQWPAVVRVRTKNSDLTESEAWFAFGVAGGTGRSLGSVVVVSRGDVTQGQWLRNQRLTIRDALPRADTIVQVSLGGIGTDFTARFDNLVLPVPVPAMLAVRPDSVTLAAAGSTYALRATVRDNAGMDIGMRPAWSSADTTVAMVDSTGVVTGTRNGVTYIFARIGTYADSTKVTVNLTPVQPARRRPGNRP